MELLRDHLWTVTGVLWLAAYFLGVFGITQQFAATGEVRSATDPFYRAFQLFVFDDSMVVSGLVRSKALEIARFMAPAVSVFAAVLTFFSVFREQFDLLRHCFYRRHVIICGLGRRGLAFACNFRDKGYKVVVIEKDEADKGIETCRDKCIIVLKGDATERSVLEKAGVTKASDIVCITGEDGTNAEIAIQAYQIINESSGDICDKVRCHIQITDLNLSDLLKHRHILSNHEDRFEASIFNSYHDSARMLFMEHPPGRGLITAQNDKTAHLIIIGFGYMGEAVALQMARADYPNNKKPRITVIDSEAATRKMAFLSRHPAFLQTCEAEFIDSDIYNPELLEKIRGWALDPASVATIVVALDGDGRALSCALIILSRLSGYDVPLIVRMPDDTGLSALIEKKETSDNALLHVHAFGMPSRICTREMLLDKETDSP